MTTTEHRISTSVLVIGTGGGGLRATLESALEREELPPIPDGIASLMHEVSAAGKLVE
ncbi:hypothetical protein ACFVYA_45365 [Amycolatopsis sp. NPDC058278]|uniref:hypothetical protein n=1 Tax=Amycolatopsis sp. NPDC058278 TaxID=3346417 RepID=UPI0036DD39DE